MIIRLLAATALAATVGVAAACSKEPTTKPIVMADNTAPKPSDKASNFTLTDQNGKSHELYALKDAKAIVLIMQGVGCPIVQQLTPDIKDTVAAFKGKGVEFMMVNSNIQDSPAMIAAEAQKFDIPIPIVKDPTQAVGSGLGAVRTAEVFIIQPKTWKVLYHGPLNDRLTYGRAKAKAENNYTANALNTILAGGTVPVVKQPADGCIINYVTKANG